MYSNKIFTWLLFLDVVSLVFPLVFEEFFSGAD